MGCQQLPQRSSTYLLVRSETKIAAVVVVALFFPVDLSEHLVECMLAGVAGIMTFLVVHEMMPLAIEHAGRKGATSSLFVGMACMSASLHLLNSVSA